MGDFIKPDGGRSRSVNEVNERRGTSAVKVDTGAAPLDKAEAVSTDGTPLVWPAVVEGALVLFLSLLMFVESPEEEEELLRRANWPWGDNEGDIIAEDRVPEVGRGELCC